MSDSKPIKLSQLIDAIDTPSDMEFCHYFDRQTGEVVMVTDEDRQAEDWYGDDREMPDWQADAVEQWKLIEADQEGEGGRFLPLPDQFDFHEYDVMRRFAHEQDGDVAEQLLRAIQGRGAFRYFKDTIHRLGVEEAWYRYRDDALRRLAIEWCEAEELAYIDDIERRTP